MRFLTKLLIVPRPSPGLRWFHLSSQYTRLIRGASVLASPTSARLASRRFGGGPAAVVPAASMATATDEPPTDRSSRMRRSHEKHSAIVARGPGEVRRAEVELVGRVREPVELPGVFGRVAPVDAEDVGLVLPLAELPNARTSCRSSCRPTTSLPTCRRSDPSRRSRTASSRRSCGSATSRRRASLRRSRAPRRSRPRRAGSSTASVSSRALSGPARRVVRCRRVVANLRRDDDTDRDGEPAGDGGEEEPEARSLSGRHGCERALPASTFALRALSHERPSGAILAVGQSRARGGDDRLPDSGPVRGL